MNRINHSSRFIEMFGPETALLRKYPVKKLGDLADCYAGATPSTTVREYWDNGTISWMSSGEVHLVHVDQTEAKITQKGYDHASTKMVPIHSVVIALAGQGRTRGTVAITEIPLCTNQSLCAIVPGEELHYEYLFHNLNGRYLELRGMAGDVNGRGGLNLRIIQNIPIVVPPMDDQLAFVTIARQADKSKFTGFKSRFIEMFGNTENTKPLSACIDTTFPGEWGEDDSEGTGVNVIRTTNFTNSGKLDLTNVVTRKIDQAKIDKKHLIPGDIILERSGGTADNPVGRVVYFEAKGTFLFNNFTQLLRCKDGVNSLFVFYSLYNYYHTHKSEIRSMGNKNTGIQNLKMDKYWEIPIADASPEQQEQFVNLYKQADKSKYLS